MDSWRATKKRARWWHRLLFRYGCFAYSSLSFLSSASYEEISPLSLHEKQEDSRERQRASTGKGKGKRRRRTRQSGRRRRLPFFSSFLFFSIIKKPYQPAVRLQEQSRPCLARRRRRRPGSAATPGGEACFRCLPFAPSPTKTQSFFFSSSCVFFSFFFSSSTPPSTTTKLAPPSSYRPPKLALLFNPRNRSYCFAISRDGAKYLIQWERERERKRETSTTFSFLFRLKKRQNILFFSSILFVFTFSRTMYFFVPCKGLQGIDR